MSRGVSRATRSWVALALVGLVVAVSVSYAASQLSKPKVGLTSEPVSGLSELAPKSVPGKRTHAPRHPKRSPAPTTTPTTTSTTTPTTTPVPLPAESNDEGGDDD